MIAKHVPDNVAINRDVRYSYKDSPEQVYAVSLQGTWYENDTPKDVIRVLEFARIHKFRLRLFFGDSVTGRDWLEEWDVAGYIGRTHGPLKSPILLHNKSSSGGGIVGANSIVKITYSRGGELLYQHPKYHHMPMAARISDLPEYEVAVWVKNHEPDGGEQIHARFKTIAQYQRWEKKMQVTIAPEIFVQRAYLESGLPYEVKAL